MSIKTPLTCDDADAMADRLLAEARLGPESRHVLVAQALMAVDVASREQALEDSGAHLLLAVAKDALLDLETVANALASMGSDPGADPFPTVRNLRKAIAKASAYLSPPQPERPCLACGMPVRAEQPERPEDVDLGGEGGTA